MPHASVGNWTQLPPTPDAFAGRAFPGAAYTGGEIVIWGGNGDCAYERADGGIACDSGVRYSISSGRWFSMSSAGAPAGRYQYSAHWNGERVLVFGGACSSSSPDAIVESPCLDGGLYDPANDSWQRVELPEWYEATIRPFVGVVGGKVLVWGGYRRGPDANGLPSKTDFNHGVVLDLDGLEWSPMSADQAPSTTAKLVSSEDRVLAFDGVTVSSFDGERWTLLEGSTIPESCCDEFMTLSGGALGFVYLPTTEGRPYKAIWRYDVDGKVWEALQLPDIEPYPGAGGAMVPTGEGLVLWGGGIGTLEWGCEGHYMQCNHGALLNFSTREWLLLSPEGALSPRSRPVSLWVGNGVFIWGGIRPDITQSNPRDGAILRFE